MAVKNRTSPKKLDVRQLQRTLVEQGARISVKNVPPEVLREYQQSIERLKSKKIDDLLRRYLGVVVGRSAGALVLCKKCVLTGRKKSTKVIDGLGLVDFVVKAHYRPMRDKDNELKKFSESERIKVYAVPHGSAVSYRYGKLSFIGDVYLFEKGEKSQISSS